ncbi:MAG: polyhydroxyalkanoate synthesis repressor PhaR [Alphaproteobacteria bacterium]|nr:polyhydroxyalkanoate synthesis repressor PhaR [Alphaproteobacteria bacterium]
MSDTASKSSVTIKKYANRRLYNTATSSYVTLENLSAMVKEGTEFNVYDAKTGEELTRSVLTQIIVEEEGKSGQNLLPVGFLRQLISFYGDNMQWMVPKYLEQSMQLLTKNQDQLRSYFQNTMGTMFPFTSKQLEDLGKQNPMGAMFPFGTTLEDMGKQNLAMFERAMQMFSPFTASQMASKEMEACCATATAAKTEAAAPATKAAATAAPTAAAAPKAAIDETVNLSTYRAAAAAPAAVKQSSNDSPEEMQQKISSLQKQLAELAKRRG